MKLSARNGTRPGWARSAGARYAADLKAAAFVATDTASKLAQGGVQRKMRAVGLGRLANAVGQTSALKKRQMNNTPYGVIFARGGDESRAGGALEAYSLGTTITPTPGKKWLAFATNAIPSRVGRFKMTPEKFRAGGYEARYGKLVFKPIDGNTALLVIRKATVTGKGRVREVGKRAARGTQPVKDLVAFVLIRFTKRAQRFDKNQEVAPYARQVPDLMQQEMLRRRR